MEQSAGTARSNMRDFHTDDAACSEFFFRRYYFNFWKFVGASATFTIITFLHHNKCIILQKWKKAATDAQHAMRCVQDSDFVQVCCFSRRSKFKMTNKLINLDCVDLKTNFFPPLFPLYLQTFRDLVEPDLRFIWFNTDSSSLRLLL